jgi:hypothetical protein
MVNQFMRIPAIIKATVALPLIGIDRATHFYMRFNKSLKCGTLNILNGNCSYRSLTLNKPDYRSFACRTSTAFPFFLPPKYVSSTSIRPDIRSVRGSRLMAFLKYLLPLFLLPLPFFFSLLIHLLETLRQYGHVIAHFLEPTNRSGLQHDGEPQDLSDAGLCQ